mmetsp:Transcript_14408/g.45787  ORF Transcript_14408/g.45787 Transcript_14408/m.45787 type:complete len:280 (-) Transcript_14408:7-846(-)
MMSYPRSVSSFMSLGSPGTGSKSPPGAGRRSFCPQISLISGRRAARRVLRWSVSGRNHTALHRAASPARTADARACNPSSLIPRPFTSRNTAASLPVPSALNSAKRAMMSFASGKEPSCGLRPRRASAPRSSWKLRASGSHPTASPSAEPRMSGCAVMRWSSEVITKSTSKHDTLRPHSARTASSEQSSTPSSSVLAAALWEHTSSISTPRHTSGVSLAPDPTRRGDIDPQRTPMVTTQRTAVAHNRLLEGGAATLPPLSPSAPMPPLRPSEVARSIHP